MIKKLRKVAQDLVNDYETYAKYEALGFIDPYTGEDVRGTVGVELLTGKTIGIRLLTTLFNERR